MRCVSVGMRTDLWRARSKRVGVAVERLAIQYLVTMSHERDATPGEMDVPHAGSTVLRADSTSESGPSLYTVDPFGLCWSCTL